MDNQDQENADKSVLTILRKITRGAQLMPFAYLLLLAVYLLSEPALSEWALHLADRIFIIPIYVLVCLLAVGRLLKLCRWYITACMLPILSKIVGYVDSYIVTLRYEEMVIVNTLLGVIYIAFIVSAYHHFIGCYGRKE